MVVLSFFQIFFSVRNDTKSIVYPDAVRWTSLIHINILDFLSSVIYANRHYLEIYRMYHPERLSKQNDFEGPTIV